jgi:RNA polymerase sigma-B factor
LERQGDDTRSGTAALLRRYHDDKDTSARQRLIELYLPLVESFARRYSGSSNDYDDLYQVGCIGLINAIDRFDFERGEELTAFAVPNITGEIRRYLRDGGATVKLPRRVLELRGAVARAQPEMRTKLGRAPTNAELARELGAAEEDVALALDGGRASDALELLPESGGEDDRGERSLDAAEDRLFLSDAFRGLDERERRVLFLRHVQDLEPNEIATELGISRRQVSRVIQDALVKLRAGLERSTSEGGDAPVPTSGRRQRTAVPKREAMREWLADTGHKGREVVPKPRAAPSHSGRLLIRMPPALHAELARAAERNQVSLNQFITSSLATAVASDDRAKLGGAAGGAAAQPAPARSRVLAANLVLLAVIAVLALVLIAIAISRL